MAILTGSNTNMAVNLQSAWGTKADTMSSIFSYTSESLKEIKDKKEEDSIVGGRSTGRLDTMANKVEGDVSGLVKPNQIGYFLAAMFGSETVQAAEVGSNVFDHTFTPIESGSASTLYPLTICVDRILKTNVYEGIKINTLKFDCKASDYLRATFSVRGRSVAESSNVVWPALGSLKAFKFLGGQCKIGSTVMAEVTGYNGTLGNNLEDNFYTLNNSAYMSEIEPQKFDATAQIDAVYTAGMEAVRSANFSADTPMSVELEFESEDAVSAGFYYTLTIKYPNAYIKDDPGPNISSRDRLKIQLNIIASEQNGSQPVEVILRDGRSTKYNLV